jgi:hypothetical protein
MLVDCQTRYGIYRAVRLRFPGDCGFHRATIDQESATTAKLFAVERVIEPVFAVNGLGYREIPNFCEWNVLDSI